MSAKSDWMKLVKEAKKRGWVEVRNNRHLMLLWPPTNRKVTISGSSEPRAIKNARKQLEQMEADLPKQALPR